MSKRKHDHLADDADDNAMTDHAKVCIIGSGPAGYTAAIYAARAELNPVLFEGELPEHTAGGQLTTTTDVENFPGFPKGILGDDLVLNMREQCERFGTKIFTETVKSVELNKTPFKINGSKTSYTADTVIIATGATAKKLEFEGSEKFWMNGISACAVCDGALPLFRNKPLFVIGGGDSAMEEASFLAKYGSKVYIVVRRDVLRASKIMQARAKNNPKIEFLYNSNVVSASGDDLLKKVSVKNSKTGEVTEYDANGLFFAIGHEPATKFLDGQLKTDDQTYVLTTPGTTQTSIPGVFAAGDVQDKKYRQAITAAGSGCMAALEAEHYLGSLEA